MTPKEKAEAVIAAMARTEYYFGTRRKAKCVKCNFATGWRHGGVPICTSCRPENCRDERIHFYEHDQAGEG